MPTEKPTRSGLIALAIAVLLVVMILAGTTSDAQRGFVSISICLALMLILLGWGTTGRPVGILVNEKNVMSLARFQMVVWTLLVLSAYFAYALARMRERIANPLDVTMDWHLWTLMGISTTSLIGSPLILDTKTDKVPAASAVTQTAQLTGEDPVAMQANGSGLVYANPTAADAKLTDMFQGDEIGNTTHVDLAKVQMFLFTLIIGVSFFWDVLQDLGTANSALDKLPQLSDGTVWLLGISHAGYLSSKGVDHTKTEP